MNKINSMLDVYKKKFSDKFRDLTSPLKTCFEIDECIYTYISNEGYYFSVSNHPEASIYYFNEDIYKSSLLIRHPDNYKQGVLIPSVMPATYEEPSCQEYGYAGDTMLVIFRKDKQGAHEFIFNRQHIKTPLLILYMDKLPLLEFFCSHMIKELDPYKKEIENHMIDIAQHIGPEFYDIVLSQKQLDEIALKEKFLKESGILPKDFQIPAPFSSQEKKCLELICNGKTASETAQLLDLSKRTVESYINNIKNKMSCFTKSEMLEQMQIYKLLGIL